MQVYKLARKLRTRGKSLHFAPKQQQIAFPENKELFSISANTLETVIEAVEAEQYESRSAAYRHACYTYFGKGPGVFSGEITRRLECVAYGMGAKITTLPSTLSWITSGASMPTLSHKRSSPKS